MCNRLGVDTKFDSYSLLFMDKPNIFEVCCVLIKAKPTFVHVVARWRGSKSILSPGPILAHIYVIMRVESQDYSGLKVNSPKIIRCIIHTGKQREYGDPFKWSSMKYVSTMRLLHRRNENIFIQIFISTFHDNVKIVLYPDCVGTFTVPADILYIHTKHSKSYIFVP